MSVGRGVLRRREGQEVNIAPLIDMVFILLIFFMVTTTFVRDAKIDIARPGARSAERADNRSVRVTAKSLVRQLKTRPATPSSDP